MRHRILITALTSLTVTVVAGCASSVKRNPVPERLINEAQIQGLPDARFAGTQSAVAYRKRMKHVHLAQVKASGLADEPPRLLAISGGGANGAFGAGLLVGWTEAGDRPSFILVTGISTGALIAPFAFLGSDYDDRLREVYTTVQTKDLLRKRNALAALFGDAFADSAPLRRMLEKYIDDAMIEAIAREHNKGRRLFIGTTDLDRMQQVYWSIGAIAASGHPRANGLIRDILWASASIPSAFPPVYFEVEAQGELYDEMHVDGGVSSQVFVYPLSLALGRELHEAGFNPDIRLFIIRNSRLSPSWAATEPKLFSIAGRSISGLLRTHGFGDLFKIYLGALRDKIDFNLAYIPTSFTRKSEEPFDQEYMQALFDVGYKLALPGYPWEKTPPGYVAP